MLTVWPALEADTSEMCGLIGVTGISDAAKEVFLGLMNLQHRGQDGAGIVSVVDFNTKQFNLQKGSGLVENIFSERSFKSLRGTVALGHTRYATIGRQDPNLLQPFLDYQAGISLAHNGNIVNVYALKDELATSGGMALPHTDSDSELILKLLTNYLSNRKPTDKSLFEGIEFLMHKLVGSYAVVGLDDTGRLFGFRDPDGIRPLVLGQKQNGDGRTVYALASETIALAYLGYSQTLEVSPGEAVLIDAQGNLQRKVLKANSYSPCMFEWVYFARVESEIGNVSVYQARFKLGLLLAEKIKNLGIEADVVVPVPETSRAAAIAIAETLGLPCRELLIKNRYVNRTFILDGQQARQEAIRKKLFPIASEIKGKRCLVVDDSIVRGNTASQIIDLMRLSGAAEVILVSTCPPIKSPCYYGIDFPSPAELIAARDNEDEIAAKLGADKVVYQSLEELKAALKQESLCTGCLTGCYPTDVSSGAEFQARRMEDRRAISGKEHVKGHVNQVG
ncbi:MAG: amidophosphoribosyltransferase [Candidatus Melainabacteria bacterium]|nr:amidophosphoribosyltransferase [Candidatus Melainabacteria bacterium]